MAEEMPDFSGPNQRAIDLLGPALNGDVVAFGENLRSATQVEGSNAIIWILASAVLLSAISNFIRRTGEATRPLVEVAAEKWRESDKKDAEA